MATQVFSFPQTSIPTGTFNIPVTSLPALQSSVTLSLARCTTPTPTIWPNATTTILVTLFASYDGGVTWDTGARSDAHGGIELLPRSTAENPTVTMRFTWPNPPTHLKGSIAVAGGPLLTSGSVTVA